MTPISRWISPALEDDDSQSKWRRFLGMSILAGAAAALLRIDLTDRAALSSAMVLSGASLFVGILVGFLFGIPKTSRRQVGGAESRGLAEGDYQSNTNLEDISDWLTKMLIGVGLVELRRVPEFVDSIAQYWESSFGPAASRSYAAGLVVYFVVVGFLVGYLWTRLALVGDFIEKDPRRMISNLLQKVATATQNDPTATERSPERQVFTSEQADAAEALQSVAKISRVPMEELRRQIRDLSGVYESIRSSMSSGSERTRRMEIVASQMRALSLAAYPLLGELARSSSPGERLAAITFLQTRPHKEYLNWLIDRLVEEKPFVGYHAAVALLHAARVTTQEESQSLRHAIEHALTVTSELPDSTDRRIVLFSAREVLDGVSTPPD